MTVGVAAQAPDEIRHVRGRGRHEIGVGAAHHQAGAVAAGTEIGVAADRHPRMGRLDGREPFGNRAFADVAGDRPYHRPRAAGQARRQPVEHGLEDLGYAGEHMDVVESEPRRPADGVVDQRGALRDIGHRQARRVEHVRRVVAFEQAQGRRVAFQGHAEGARHRGGGDVVVGRADAAGGEDIGAARPQVVDRRGDHLAVVGDDPCLRHRDAELGQPFGQKRQVGVPGAAGQDLVADDQDGSGDGHGNRVPVAASAG